MEDQQRKTYKGAPLLQVAQIFAVASMLSFVAAVPSPQYGSVQECGDGNSQQCCNSFQDAQTESVQHILVELLGANAAAAVTGQVGLDCSLIASVAAGSACNQQTACCSNDDFNGLVAIGCNNINV